MPPFSAFLYIRTPSAIGGKRRETGGREERELRTKSDEELIDWYDRSADNTIIGISFLLDELNRRESARVATAVKNLTWVLAVLTVVLVALTVATLASA